MKLSVTKLWKKRQLDQQKEIRCLHLRILPQGKFKLQKLMIKIRARIPKNTSQADEVLQNTREVP